MTGGLRVVPTPPGKPLTRAMLEDVREALSTSRLEPTGEIGRGYISEGEVYATDTDKVFIKRNSDKEVFYARQLDNQFRKITRVFGNREANELWSELQLKIPSFFANVKIKPSLLHGDLYYGNTAETINGPVMFDPGSLYGHHEFDCVISAMCGSFSSEVWEEYYTRVPRAPGWHPRQKLYKLFHLANQWNHFGSERASVCLREMKELCHLGESRSEPVPAGIVQPVPPPSSS